MTKTFVWGFCGPIGAAIVRELGNRDLEVCGWISDQPRSLSIWDFLLGRLHASEKNAQDLEQYEQFYERHFETFLVMITRRGLAYADLHEINNEFSLGYHYFSGALRKHQIELVVFANMPHEGQDFVLYNVAKLHGVRTLICYQTLFADRFFLLTRMDDLGAFTTAPQVLSHDEVPLMPGYRQQSVNMDGLNLADDPSSRSLGAQASRAYTSLKSRAAAFARYPVRPVKEAVKGALVKKSDASLQRRYVQQLREHALSDSQVDALLAGPHKIVYVPLHLQPELTTSALGGVYQDQLHAVEILSTMLDADWLIVMKENPKQTFFQRGEHFFERLRALANVRLAGNGYSTYKLLERARFVATISGTACWEAMKGGKRCLVFGQAWYASLPGCYTYRPGFDFNAFLAAVDTPVPFEELRRAFGHLMCHTGAGVVDRDYSVLVSEFEVDGNAAKVADALTTVIRSPQTMWA